MAIIAPDGANKKTVGILEEAPEFWCPELWCSNTFEFGDLVGEPLPMLVDYQW